MGEHETSGERLAKVEAAIEHIKDGVKGLNQRLDQLFDQLEKRYVQVTVHKESVDRLHERLDVQQEQIRELHAKSGRVPAWAATAITFLITLVGALLGVHFIH